MIISRKQQEFLIKTASQFRVIAIMGPRQSGKTTLARQTFTNHAYVNLEDLDKRAIAKNDPRGFLRGFLETPGVIIDEIQEVPELFSYLQAIVDEQYRPGHFIITGSQHFLMHEKITQSLAGRIALITLLPFSMHELQQAKKLPQTSEELLIKGCYPELYAHEIDIQQWCANYINTYIEKDVRQVLQISDVVTFQRFLKLCAARVGNIINYASLARDADISPNTAKAWISVLQASFIITLLQPHYNNFNKRVIKSPKLYFNDTALVCSLLGIHSADDIRFHPIKGALFESLIINECFKYSYNRNRNPQLYFWRDIQGHEIDIIVERSLGDIVPIEIKAGMTINSSFFKNLDVWKKIAKQDSQPSYIVYNGFEQTLYNTYTIAPWQATARLLDTIYNNT